MTFPERTRKKIIFTMGVIILVVAGVYSLVYLQPKEPVQGQTMLKYKRFESKNPALDFSFEYPDLGWLPSESQGRKEKYDLVYLQGPTDKDVGFNTMLHITVRPLQTGETISDLSKNFLKRISVLERFKMLREDSPKIGGEKAASVFYEYEDLPLYNTKPSPVLLKGHRIYLVRNGRSYEFVFESIADQYKNYDMILEHVLKTFKFKG